MQCLGNLLELLQRPVGEADFAWQSQYGNVVRFKSVLGVSPLTRLSRISSILTYVSTNLRKIGSWSQTRKLCRKY